MNDLIVSETFGPTFQGEGPSAGRRAFFIRLGLCNLDCAWCDTPYTWDWTGKNGPPQDKSALVHVSVPDMLNRVNEVNAPLVVITGGEPMLQQRKIRRLIEEADDWFDFEIETNGTIEPDTPMRCRYNVSPKLHSSGVNAEHAVQAVKNFGRNFSADFKFVIADRIDLDCLDRLLGHHPVPPARVWVMPEGRTADVLLRNGLWLAEAALERGYNFTQRLHVLLWGDERGR